MKKTPWIIAAAAVCVVGVGGGGTAFAMSNEAARSACTASRRWSVPSRSPLSRELLEAQGVELKDTDLVVPDLGEQVTDGLDIQIIHRTPVTVTVDGADQEVLTSGDTVADALEDIDYKAEGAQRDACSRHRAQRREAAQVDVVTRKTVTFVGQKGQDTFEVTALTVDDAMKKVLGDIEDTDKASVDRDSILEDGATITIKRVREAERTETVEVPFETKTVEDDELLEGTTKTTTEGKKGTTERVFAEKTVDGEVTESELVSEKVAEKPVTEVITKGTKPAPEPEPAPSRSPRSKPESVVLLGVEQAPSEKTNEMPSERVRTEEDRRTEPRGASSAVRPGGEACAQCAVGLRWLRVGPSRPVRVGAQLVHQDGGTGSPAVSSSPVDLARLRRRRYARVAHQASREQQIS